MVPNPYTHGPEIKNKSIEEQQGKMSEINFPASTGALLLRF